MNREKTIIRTSIIGILANLLLVGFKAFIGILSGSIAIILDAVNNLSDALSSGITIVGTKLANKRPDAAHPYGHGRIEYITSLIISAIVLFAGFAAIYESIQTLINRVEISYTYWAIIIVSAAIVVKIAIGLYFRYVGKKINSDALKASGIDALFDSILSMATLVAVLVSMFTGVNIEGWLGIVIGLFIIKTGFEIFRSSLSRIIGERISKETSQGIKTLICEHDGVKGAYDLIVNSYGPQRAYGSVHIEVDDTMTAKEIHLLTRHIAEDVFVEYGIILTIGIYASNSSNEEDNEIKDYISNEVAKYQEILQLHGLYIDREKMIISFDIIIDFACKEPNVIRNKLFADLHEKFPLFDFYIVLDHDMSD